MKKITQKDVNKAWGKAWEDRDKAWDKAWKAWKDWEEARKLEMKFEEQENSKDGT